MAAESTPPHEMSQQNQAGAKPRTSTPSSRPSPRGLTPDPNLTETQLVEPRNVASPVPNHSLVICKRVGSGHVVRRVIPPNKIFRTYLRRRRQSFFAYAVPHGRKWLTFKNSYSIPGPVSNVELSFTLTYEVEHHAKLVEMLRDDPLQVLQRKVEAKFAQFAQELTWATPTAEDYALESYSLPYSELRQLNASEACAAPLFEDLQAFALDYGLQVTGLLVSRDLSQQDRDFLREMERLRQAEKLQNLQHRITLNESVFQELLQKLRVLIGRIDPDSVAVDMIEKLREFTALLQGLVALPPADRAAHLGHSATNPAPTKGTDRRTAQG
jgi:hypothetical protein